MEIHWLKKTDSKFIKESIEIAVDSTQTLEDLKELNETKTFLIKRLEGDYFTKLFDFMEIVIITENDKILGLCGLKKLKNSNKIGVIDKLYVNKNIKGKGLGSQLINFLFNRATEREFEKLVLEAFPSAVKFYEKVGFSITGQSTFSPPKSNEKLSLITMEKNLRK
jgi:N-acetylglutamate synthase-like GNAT family acetyltransferase